LGGHTNGVVDSALRVTNAGKNRIEIVSADFFGPILSYRKIGRFAYRSFSRQNMQTGPPNEVSRSTTEVFTPENVAIPLVRRTSTQCQKLGGRLFFL
jgi:hypothetical protein